VVAKIRPVGDIYIYIYVYMYVVYMYVYMYIYIYIYIYMCVCVYMYKYPYYIHVCIYIYIYIYGSLLVFFTCTDGPVLQRTRGGASRCGDPALGGRPDEQCPSYGSQRAWQVSSCLAKSWIYV